MTPESRPRILSLGAEERLRALEAVPLLASCSAAERRHLAENARVLAFDDGETIVREGEEGLGFYLVLSGAAVVRRGDEVLNRIERGGFFGEVALLEGVPRTADVVADGDTVCLGLVRADFRKLLVREPTLAMTIIEEEGRRLGPDPLLESPPDSPPE